MTFASLVADTLEEVREVLVEMEEEREILARVLECVTKFGLERNGTEEEERKEESSNNFSQVEYVCSNSSSPSVFFDAVETLTSDEEEGQERQGEEEEEEEEGEREREGELNNERGRMEGEEEEEEEGEKEREGELNNEIGRMEGEEEEEEGEKEREGELNNEIGRMEGEEEEECLEEGRMIGEGENNEEAEQQQQREKEEENNETNKEQQEQHKGELGESNGEEEQRDNNTHEPKQQEKSIIKNVRRSRLPVPKPKSDLSQLKSIVSMLWKNVGRDLTRLSVPVTFNEPINILQRMCEQFEYSEILDRACSLRDPADRVLNVALFAISGYWSTLHRYECKPYMPLLGETYECDRALDYGFRFVAEKVMHYPTVCACYVEGVAGYTYTEWLCICTKLWAKSMALVPKGKTVLYLKRPNGGRDGAGKGESESGDKKNDTEEEDCYDGKRNEGKGNKEDEEKKNEIETETEPDRKEGNVIQEDQYEWNKVTTTIYNLLIPGAKTYIQHTGDMVIKDNTNGYQCRITFHQGSYFRQNRHRVTGTVYDASGREVRSIYGSLTDGIYLGESPGVPLWLPNPMPDGYDSYYGLTQFATELNELEDGLLDRLPPTDTRLRPDQRCLEEGRAEEAQALKEELEVTQRQKRKQREETGEMYAPRWFQRESGESERRENEKEESEERVSEERVSEERVSEERVSEERGEIDGDLGLTHSTTNTAPPNNNNTTLHSLFSTEHHFTTSADSTKPASEERHRDSVMMMMMMMCGNQVKTMLVLVLMVAAITNAAPSYES
ncbi:hypothetical protein Pcinc_012218, partial [Petrolisthes cinctipes]